MIEYYIIAAIVVALAFFLFGIRIVRPTQRAVVETWGKYTRFAGQGFNWVVPIAQRLISVNITERMQEIDRQIVITEDKLNTEVDLVVFYKVKPSEEEVKRSLYSVNDFKSQIVTLAQTTVRNVIGGMEFKDVNAERNKLNTKLAEIMKKETAAWGVDIIRVELKEIVPPQDVQDTMNKVIMAENKKRAAIDTATATETEADGLRRAKIKEAEGQRQYSILIAEGQAKAFDLINKSFKGNAQKLKSMEVTQASLQNNAKVVLTEKGINHQIILGNLPIDKGSD